MGIARAPLTIRALTDPQTRPRVLLGLICAVLLAAVGVALILTGTIVRCGLLGNTAVTFECSPTGRLNPAGTIIVWTGIGMIAVAPSLLFAVPSYLARRARKRAGASAPVVERYGL